MRSRLFLQGKYVLRLAVELPAYYVRWVVVSRQPLHKKMFWERLGGLAPVPGAPGRRVVIDANGHGEYNQIHTFAQLFKRRYPDWTLLVISWNPEIVELASTNPLVDAAYFVPWDLGWTTRRALRRLAPRLLITVDQVRFPVILNTAKALGIKTILVSAKLPREYVGSVHLRRALAYEFHRSFDKICVADDDDRQRFLELRCEPDKLVVAGYMKYDLDYLRITDAQRQQLKDALGLGRASAVWVAGSVRRGEERLVLEAYAALRQRLPGVRLVLVPRYVPDAKEACRVAQAQGLSVVLKTQMNPAPSGSSASQDGRQEHGSHACSPETIQSESGWGGVNGHLTDDAVIIIDTYGELSKLYGIADVVFIGNSLSPGDRFALGQNLIEPLAHQKPVVFGPFMNKWKPVTSRLRAAWEGLEVRDSRELAASTAHLLEHPETVQRVRRTIDEILEQNRLAVAKNFAETMALLES